MYIIVDCISKVTGLQTDIALWPVFFHDIACIILSQSVSVPHVSVSSQLREHYITDTTCCMNNYKYFEILMGNDKSSCLKLHEKSEFYKAHS